MLAHRFWSHFRFRSFPAILQSAQKSDEKNIKSKMPVEIEGNVVEMPSPKKQRTMQSEASGSVVLRFAKLTDRAYMPTKGSKLAAGYDLYSAYDEVVPAKGKKLVKTDIQIALPDGCYGRVAPRSGLAHKHFIDVGAGVIDQDYRGNVGVVMFNFNDVDFEVKTGDRIAQLVCERIYLPELVEEETLDETDRGSGGFGSTGKN